MNAWPPTYSTCWICQVRITLSEIIKRKSFIWSWIWSCHSEIVSEQIVSIISLVNKKFDKRNEQVSIEKFSLQIYGSDNIGVKDIIEVITLFIYYGICSAYTYNENH